MCAVECWEYHREHRSPYEVVAFKNCSDLDTRERRCETRWNLNWRQSLLHKQLLVAPPDSINSLLYFRLDNMVEHLRGLC